jgi:hypothetical protein
VAGSGNLILIFWISAQVNRAVLEAQAATWVNFFFFFYSMMKAILNGSMDHNMRDGCTTRQDGVFPEETLLEIMDG